MLRKALIATVALAAALLAASGDAQTVYPRGAPTATIAVGGTAVTVIPGRVNGCWIYNPLSAGDQGLVTAEVAYVDPVNTATTTGNNTNSTLQPGQSFSCIPYSNLAVTANAATSGHKLTVVQW